MRRCKWPNLENNPIYIDYHDKEWGVPSHDDRHLFEKLILESFHCTHYGDFNLQLTTNELSDTVAKDLKKRGFKFMGTVTTYSYLEAIGIMNNHASDCFLYHKDR